jgi:hypothetical protein
MELINRQEKLYNLALCTIDENGMEDCETASKNGDIDLVLQTVAYIAIAFTDKYPDRKIYFTGSDNLRTRVYQLNIFTSLDLINEYFTIEGLTIANNLLIEREPFKKGKNYQAFIFTRIKNN